MDYAFITRTVLFKGLSEAETERMLKELSAYERSFHKDDVIYHAGDVVRCLGIVLTGSVNIVMNYYWGSSNIFGHIAAGEIFAETYSAIPGKELAVDVIAAEDCSILFIDTGRLLEADDTGSLQGRMIRNLLRISSQKNLNLSARMMHTASRSIRQRLLSYLSEQAIAHDSSTFTIPFSRQQLADYLNVERSALSNELSKMQKDGLISYHKNEFSLIETEE